MAPSALSLGETVTGVTWVTASADGHFSSLCRLTSSPAGCGNLDGQSRERRAEDVEEEEEEQEEEGLPLKSYEPLNHGQEISRFLKSAAQGIFGQRNIVYGLKGPADGFIKETFIIAGKRNKTFLK